MFSLPVKLPSACNTNSCFISFFHFSFIRLNISSKVCCLTSGSSVDSSYYSSLSSTAGVSLVKPSPYCSALLNCSFKASFSCTTSSNFWWKSSFIRLCFSCILVMNFSTFTLSPWIDGSILWGECAAIFIRNDGLFYVSC